MMVVKDVNDRDFATGLYWAGMAGVLLSAVVLVSISSMPFAWIAAQSQAWLRRPDRFTPELFAGIAIRMNVLAVIFILLAAFGLAFRSMLVTGMRSCTQTWSVLARDARLALSRTLDEDRVYLIGMLVITLAAAYIRIRHQNLPMTNDEAYTFNAYASRPLFFGLSYYSAANNHLLHTILMHISHRIGGIEPWVLRMPASLAGIALIPASYLAFRYLFSAPAALLATGLIAASTELVVYSVTARGYTLLALLFILSLLLASYVIRKANAAACTVLALLCAMGFYTIPIMLYGFGALMSWIAMSRLRSGAHAGIWQALRPVLVIVLITGMATAALHLPVFAASGFDYVARQPTRRPGVLAPSALSLCRGLAEMCMSVWRDWHRDQTLAMSLALNAGFLLSVARYRPRFPKRVHPVWAAVLFCAPLLILMRAVPFNRVWLFFLPVYFGVAADGLISCIDWTKRPKTAVAWSALTTLGIVLYTLLRLYRLEPSIPARQVGPTLHLENPEQIACYLQEQLVEGDMILGPGPSNRVLEYYFIRVGFNQMPFYNEDFAPNRVFVLERAGADDSELNLENLRRLKGFETCTDADLEPGMVFPEIVVRVVLRSDTDARQTKCTQTDTGQYIIGQRPIL